jgi:hypothetical protein
VKPRANRGSVELSMGPHNARDGWGVARITYDTANPKHLAQIEAAITALIAAERGRPTGGLTRVAGESARAAS